MYSKNVRKRYLNLFGKVKKKRAKHIVPRYAKERGGLALPDISVFCGLLLSLVKRLGDLGVIPIYGITSLKLMQILKIVLQY